jgi:hypothetical protein
VERPAQLRGVESGPVVRAHSQDPKAAEDRDGFRLFSLNEGQSGFSQELNELIVGRPQFQHFMLHREQLLEILRHNYFRVHALLVCNGPERN